MLASASGIDGDGKVALFFALAGIAALWLGRGPSIIFGIVGVCTLALGVYDAIHIHRVVARVTLFGAQVDHVGWGVYAVSAGGAAMTLLAVHSLRAPVERRKPPQPDP